MNNTTATQSTRTALRRSRRRASQTRRRHRRADRLLPDRRVRLRRPVGRRGPHGADRNADAERRATPRRWRRRRRSPPRCTPPARAKVRRTSTPTRSRSQQARADGRRRWPRRTACTSTRTSTCEFGKRVFNSGDRHLADPVGRRRRTTSCRSSPAALSNDVAAAGRPVAAGVRLGRRPVEGAADDVGHGVRRGPRPGGGARLLGVDERRQQLVDSALPQQRASRRCSTACGTRCATPIPSGRARATSKFPSTGFGTINSAAGTYVSSTDTATIRSTLGLNANVERRAASIPYPAGRPQHQTARPRTSRAIPPATRCGTATSTS